MCQIALKGYERSFKNHCSITFAALHTIQARTSKTNRYICYCNSKRNKDTTQQGSSRGRCKTRIPQQTDKTKLHTETIQEDVQGIRRNYVDETNTGATKNECRNNETSPKQNMSMLTQRCFCQVSSDV
ncbi:unnamed protein product [Ixodes pacificus]